MKASIAQILRDIDGCENVGDIGATVQVHWPTIRAALLAYEPPRSALRTILDHEVHDSGTRTWINVTMSEIADARAELDELERK
jgi:hypothetical protein